MNLKITYSLLRNLAYKSLFREEHVLKTSFEENSLNFIHSYSKNMVNELAKLDIPEKELIEVQINKKIDISEIFEDKYLSYRIPSKEDLELWGKTEDSSNSHKVSWILLIDKDRKEKLIHGSKVHEIIMTKITVGVVQASYISLDLDIESKSLNIKYITKLPSGYEMEKPRKTLRKDVSFKGLMEAAWFVYLLVFSVYALVVIYEFIFS